MAVRWTGGMWRSQIEKLTGSAEFAPPAASAVLAALEAKLDLALPKALRALLAESNGVLGEYALGLVWPAERIVEDNLSFRLRAEFKDLYMPFDSLLFFADAGNGDQFAFAILNGHIQRDDVFAWNHEDDSRTWVAPSLDKYLSWWLDGTIKL
jgi:hypothetical protein